MEKGDSIELSNDCTFLLHGIPQEVDTGRRGKGGVGIALNKLATHSWKKAGSLIITDFGPRIIATRLKVFDQKNNPCFVFLISAYAPIGVANQLIWDRFLDNLQNCIDAKHDTDILVIGCDTNSSIGTCNEVRTTESIPSLGKYGIPYQNAAGIRFLTFLEINHLVATSTYFRKNSYVTWRHPHSKLPYQIDHILVEKSSFCRIINVATVKPVLDTDHLAIFCKLRILYNICKAIPNKRPLVKLDTDQLCVNKELSTQFNRFVRTKIESASRNPSYETLAGAMHQGAISVLKKKSRSSPDWFTSNKAELLHLIEKRNTAIHSKIKRTTRSSTNRARQARKVLKIAISRTKSEWIADLCNNLNLSAARQKGTKTFWDCIKAIKRGLVKPLPSAPIMMYKEDGTKCQSPEDNAEVFKKHFEKLYNKPSNSDPSILDHLEDSPIDDPLGFTPSIEEVRSAINHLKNNSPGESGITAQMFKSIAQDNICFDYLFRIVSNIWSNEECPPQWDIGRLVILPKKGDLSKPGNYRGIMLLEIAYKIVAIIINKRLQPLIERLDHENQCGFRKGRGCTDAVFTVKMAIKKRREHNLETWILFLDLVKAFDRVPRELLWCVLSKFGVPKKMIDVLKLLHKNFQVTFDIETVTHTMPSTIGVKQGDILGPALFIIFMAAVMITWRKIHNRPLCIFRTKYDSKLTGRRYNSKGTDFDVDDSEYADDTAVVFDSREDTVTYSPLLVEHFDHFCLEIHVGDYDLPDKPSKTEILFVSKPLKSYTDPESFDNTSLSNIELGISHSLISFAT